VEHLKMIAFAKPVVADADVHREFVVMLPALESRLRRKFRRDRADRREEHIAEAVAWSWQMYLAACRRGRDVTPGNLAWFSAKAVKAGRLLAGSTDLDAMSDSPRARARVGTHVSLPEAGGGAATRFDQVFGDHRWRWPVLDVVAPAMDLQTFLAACDYRDRKIVQMKSQGHEQIAIAAELGVSPSAVCLRLRAMRRRWDAQGVA
jgi:hypothetical protein